MFQNKLKKLPGKMKQGALVSPSGIKLGTNTPTAKNKASAGYAHSPVKRRAAVISTSPNKTYTFSHSEGLLFANFQNLTGVKQASSIYDKQIDDDDLVNMSDEDIYNFYQKRNKEKASDALTIRANERAAYRAKLDTSKELRGYARLNLAEPIGKLLFN